MLDRFGQRKMSRGSSYMMGEYYTPPLQLGRLGSGKSFGLGSLLGLESHWGCRRTALMTLTFSLIEVVGAWANYLWAPRPVFVDPANN